MHSTPWDVMAAAMAHRAAGAAARCWLLAGATPRTRAIGTAASQAADAAHSARQITPGAGGPADFITAAADVAQPAGTSQLSPTAARTLHAQPQRPALPQSGCSGRSYVPPAVRGLGPASQWAACAAVAPLVGGASTSSPMRPTAAPVDVPPWVQDRRSLVDTEACGRRTLTTGNIFSGLAERPMRGDPTGPPAFVFDIDGVLVRGKVR